MGVPFESLLPYAIMVGMFGLTGGSLTTIRWYSNNEKRHRYGLDKWDRQMIERDFRLTGIKRGQTDSVDAPPGFEVSNPWKMEQRIV